MRILLLGDGGVMSGAAARFFNAVDGVVCISECGTEYFDAVVEGDDYDVVIIEASTWFAFKQGYWQGRLIGVPVFLWGEHENARMYRKCKNAIKQGAVVGVFPRVMPLTNMLQAMSLYTGCHEKKSIPCDGDVDKAHEVKKKIMMQRLMRGVLDGKSNKEIALDVCKSVPAVKYRLGQIYRYLNVSGRRDILRSENLSL